MLQQRIIRSLSSTAAPYPPGTNNNRVPKSLYRQLLAWCNQYAQVPFNPIPPMSLTPPQVNASALKRLKDFRTFIEINNITARIPRRRMAKMMRTNDAQHCLENIIIRLILQCTMIE